MTESDPSTAGLPVTDTTKQALISAALIIATLLAYYVVSGHNFILNWDDYDYVVNNKAIQGLSIENVKAIFSGYFVGNYAPVHLLSYVLDYLIWNLNPHGYHISNVLIHTLNGILVYRLFLALNITALPAMFGAALFLLHPVQVETVAWISERKNLLACFFTLMSLLCYFHFRRAEVHALRHYCLSLFFLVLALLSKSIAVVFPLIIICYDICFKEPNRSRTGVANYLPFLLLAVAAGILTIVSQAAELGGGRRDYPGGSILSALWTMAPVLIAYLKDILLPTGLSPYYMIPIRKSADSAALLSLLMLGGTGIFLAGSIKRHPKLFFFAAVFIVSLLPVLQIIPILTLKNDRYLYLPMIGAAGIGALLLSHLMQTFSKFRTAVLSAAIIICISFAVATHNQARHWDDEISLWSFALDQDRENMLAWLMLAKGYTNRGYGQYAVETFEVYKALKRKYGPLRGWEGLGA